LKRAISNKQRNLGEPSELIKAQRTLLIFAKDLEMKHFFEIINTWIFSYMAQMGFILFESDAISAEQLKALADKQEELGRATESIKNFRTETLDKFLDLERRMSTQPPSGNGMPTDSLAEIVIKSDSAKDVREGKTRNSGFAVKATDLFGDFERKNTVVNSGNVIQAATRNPMIVGNAQRRLFIREVMPVGIATSNSVETTRESVFVNNAGAQYASPAFEGVVKNESGITLELLENRVVTLAHFLKVSKQALSDQPQLSNFLSQRLLYGLNLKLEDQILNGTNSSGQMSGLLHAGNFTAYSAHQTGDTKIDTIRRAIGQLQNNDFVPDVVVVNPSDWTGIELTKTSTGEYVFSQAALAAMPELWGVHVVVTNSIAAGKFMVADLAQSTMLWMREEGRVELNLDANDFTKNLVTILAECRATVSVFLVSGIISGSL
jgi:HK97 family phage major capsid protein